jgi:hypothetical protein
MFFVLSGDRVHQHAARDGRDGDGRLEADGRLPPPPHRRGIPGPCQPTDTAHGPATEETQVGKFGESFHCCDHCLTTPFNAEAFRALASQQIPPMGPPRKKLK